MGTGQTNRQTDRHMGRQTFLGKYYFRLGNSASLLHPRDCHENFDPKTKKMFIVKNPQFCFK